MYYQLGTGVTIETNGRASSLVLSPQQWVTEVNLTGIDASALKFGGVSKHKQMVLVLVLVSLHQVVVSHQLNCNVTGTASLATDLAINGTNQLLYQDSNNDTAILNRCCSIFRVVHNHSG